MTRKKKKYKTFRLASWVKLPCCDAKEEGGRLMRRYPNGTLRHDGCGRIISPRAEAEIVKAISRVQTAQLAEELRRSSGNMGW